MELEAIKAYWDYQKSDRPAHHIGMSALGHCKRQNAYKYHEIPGKPLDWRAKVIFDDGHVHHDQIRKALREGLILQDSCYSLTREEEQVQLGYVTGHIDGWLQHDHLKCQNPDHGSKLLEVKSMNDRGFQELRKTGTLSPEYATQTSAYLRATGLKEALILAKNKNTGEMLTLTYEGDSDLLDSRLTALYQVHTSKDAEDVEREYAPDSSGKLPWNCGYCPYAMLCWRDNGVMEESPHKFRLLTKSVIDAHESSTKRAKKEKPKEFPTE